MAFRLPPSLTVGEIYQAVDPQAVTALEDAMPARSRVLVKLVFEKRYDGITEDCEKAELALREAGIPVWPEYDRLVTLDEDGEPAVWISYRSSPAFWVPILVIVGGIFLLPILAALPLKIVDLLFPGAIEMLSMIAMMLVMGGVVMFMPKLMGGKT